MFMVWNMTCREINWNIWRGCGAVRGEGVKCSETQIQQGTCIYGSWQIAAVMAYGQRRRDRIVGRIPSG